MFNVQIKNTIKVPKAFVFVEDLEEVANRFIIPDILGRIVMQQDLRGTKYPPLAESTLKAKARKGLSLQVLTATGILRNSIFAKREGKTRVVIKIKPIRAQVGKILQVEGVRTKRGKRFFNFFGISTIAERKSLEFLRRKIKNAKA